MAKKRVKSSKSVKGKGSKSALRSGRHRSSTLKDVGGKMKRKGRKKCADGKMRGRLKKE